MVQTKRPIRVVLKSSSSSSSSSASASAKSEEDLTTKKESQSQESSELDLESDGSQSELESGEDLDDSLSITSSSIRSSPRKLTARQRAILEKEEEIAMPAPMVRGRRTKKVPLTEEEAALEAEKERKRRHLRDQKLEESKRATIERLLQKQGTRSKKAGQRHMPGESRSDTVVGETMESSSTMVTSTIPLNSSTIKYRSGRDGEFLIVPDSAMHDTYFNKL